MALDNRTIEIIIKTIEGELINSTIGMPIIISDKEFAFPYSKEDNNKIIRGNLVFSLNPSLPFLLATKERLTGINSSLAFFSSLKKIAYTKVKSINKRSNERIISICLDANSNDISEQNTGYEIIIELFPNHPNFYLIAYPSNKIISLYKEYTNLEKGIFIVKNSSYIYPNIQKENITYFNKFEDAGPYFPNNLYKLLVSYSKENISIFNETIEKLHNSNTLYLVDNDIFPFHFEKPNAKIINPFDIYTELKSKENKSKNEDKERALIETLTKLVHASERKIKNLTSDLKKAKQNLIYKEYGQYIYMCQSEIKNKDKVLEVEGYKIELDPKLNPSENANNYFKKYQKAKAATTILTNLIENAKLENTYLSKKLIEAKDGTARDIQELKTELYESGYLKSGKGKNYIQKFSKNRKYTPHYIILNNAKIGFGMNGLQNEELTFKIAKEDDLFIHVKDYPGSHIILFGNKSEDNIILACELALYISHLDNGELMVCKKKYVKKNSLKLGLVKIKTYNSIVIKNIRNESINLFNSSLKK